jgi:hypothetical protein
MTFFEPKICRIDSIVGKLNITFETSKLSFTKTGLVVFVPILSG